MRLPRSIKRGLQRMLGEHPTTPENSSAESPAAGAAGASDVLSNLPVLIGTALLSAALVLIFIRLTTVATPRVVTFDVVKYVNAERAVASQFFGNGDQGDVAPTLLQVSKKTRNAIQEVAGPGTLVVISQAIVQGQTEDITDQVLKRLGLPTNVPTVSPTKEAFDIAPTMVGHNPSIYTNPKTQAPPEQTSSKVLP